MIMASIQEVFSKSLQDQKDTFDLIKNDLDLIIQKLPIEDVFTLLSTNLEGTEIAKGILIDFITENLLPIIQGHIEVAQVQAVDTVLDWEKALL
jgi:hypothetical protein